MSFTGKRVLFTAVVVALIAILVVVFYPRNKGEAVQFATKETKFEVQAPEGWKVVEQPRKPATADREATPDEGVELRLNGSEQNKVYVFNQYGTLSPPEEKLEQEAFTTTQGIKGTLYKDAANHTWWLILDQSIAPGFYGATVRFEDAELFEKNQDTFREILGSIKIFKP
ncbi:hypothetical protein [Gorillibacterium timonense]|uniref:hypothetical protein n=1 Tax=Gorillibacterium timonense TaxID=1689269 RepID=UPI00071D737D|nr:hypothetical protein [Gorillibacterium timonense]